jgi:hypothetical protein
LQAIAQGCPTILTDAHGQAEFAQLGIPISAKLGPADFFMAGPAGDWWEPSLDELCERMEWVYYHYDVACADAARSSKVAHATYTWENTAARFIEAVGPEHFTTPHAGPRTWELPIYRRYPVRVTTLWKAEVAQTVYQFEPGRTYHETADVKRILYEANVLHPDCITVNPSGVPTAEETGLTPDEVARIPQYSASHSYCHACGQMLGTGVRYDPPV